MAERKTRIHQLKQIVNHMQEGLNNFNDPQRPPAKWSKKKSNILIQKTPSIASRKSVSHESEQRQSGSKIMTASPHKLVEKSFNINTPERWKLNHRENKNSIQKLWNISEVINGQYYTEIDSRKSQPKQKQIVKSIEKVDKKYYIGQKENVKVKMADTKGKGLGIRLSKELVKRESKELIKRESKELIKKQDKGQIKKHHQSVNQALLSKRQRTKIFPENNKVAFTDRNQNDSIVPRRHKIERSPEGFLEGGHPNSNPNLNFFGGMGIVSRGKGSVSPDKNQSKLVGGEAMLEIPSFCNRKHFNRYFFDQYSSSLN